MRLNNIKIFLFGSYDKIVNPNDIDLLILYDKDFISITNILSLRRRILTNFKQVSDIQVDISLLSFFEEKELNFVKTEKARKLILD